MSIEILFFHFRNVETPFARFVMGLMQYSNKHNVFLCFQLNVAERRYGKKNFPMKNADNSYKKQTKRIDRRTNDGSRHYFKRLTEHAQYSGTPFNNKLYVHMHEI